MFYFVGAIIGRPFLVPLSPPLSRLCRQLPSMGALLMPLLEERWHAVSEWWLLFDVLFFPAGDQWSPLHSFFVGAVIGRPFLVPKISYETAPSTSLFFLLATNGRHYIHFSQGRSLAARFQFPKLRTGRRPRRPFYCHLSLSHIPTR